MYTDFADGINTLFYDACTVIGLVFGEEEAAAGKLVDAIREQARMHTVSSTVGLPSILLLVACPINGYDNFSKYNTMGLMEKQCQYSLNHCISFYSTPEFCTDLVDNLLS